jgi:hypothetical protein
MADHPARVAPSAATSWARYNYAPIALISGPKLGPYEIQSPLGAGGSFRQWQAEGAEEPLWITRSYVILAQNFYQKRDSWQKAGTEAGETTTSLGHKST